MKEIEPTLNEFINERILREREQKIRFQELDLRKKQLEELPEDASNWSVKQLKTWVDLELEKRIPLESKRIFLNDAIGRAERHISQTESHHAKNQSERLLARINRAGEYLAYLRKLSQEMDSENPVSPNPKIKAIDLTERLLIIRYLQQHNQFPQYNPTEGHTKKMFEEFVSLLLSESKDAVKKGFQRVDKILKSTDLTKENKTDRLKQLKNVSSYFTSIDKKECVSDIQKLISKINKKELV